MNNLISKAKNVNGNTIGKQIAEMETYRVYVYLFMVIHNVFYDIKYACIKLISLFDKTRSVAAYETGRETWDRLLERNNRTITSDSLISSKLIKNICHCIRKGAFLPVSKKSGEDYISGCMTRTAAKLFRSKEISGKSVYEINDYIYTKFPDKRADIRKMLRIWLVTAIAFVVMGVVFLLLQQDYYVPVILVMVAAEIIGCVFISRKISILHLAKLIWLITSETGMNSSEKVNLPISSLGRREKQLLDIRMRAVHSLIKSQYALSDEISTLTSENDDNSRQMKKNTESIDALRNTCHFDKERSAGTKEEVEKAIKAKEDDNKILDDKIKDNKNRISGKNEELQNVKSLLSKLEKWIIDEFKKNWNSSYKNIIVSDQAICSFLSGCRFEDISNVEKRFYEIENTAKPFEIAKKKNGKAFFEWITLGGDVANIVISNSDDSKKVSIAEINCLQPLNESFATADELKEALNGLEEPNAGEYEARIKELIDWYKNELQNWEKEKEQLENLNRKLSDAKSRLIGEVERKQAEIDNLQQTIDKKNAECTNLQEQLDALTESGDKEIIEELRKKLEVVNNELLMLQQEYEAKQHEMEALYENIAKFIKTEKVLNDKLSKKVEELKNSQLRIRELKEKINTQKETIKKKEEEKKIIVGNLAVTKGLLSKAEESNKVDQKTIEKLRDQKSGLETQNHELNKIIENNTVKINEQEVAIKKAEEGINKLKDEIERLQNTVDNSEIAYDEQIYDVLYDWILAAQEYIYIVAPFVSKYQFNNMKRKLKEAAFNNPDLKIKLLYGLQDKKSDGTLCKPEVIETARKFVPELTKELGKAISVKETNTHVKVVIVDDKKYILGSANVMSFSGEYSKSNDLHSEVAVISYNQKQVLELKKKYFYW